MRYVERRTRHFEASSGAEMPVVQERSIRAAGSHDQADPRARDRGRNTIEPHVGDKVIPVRLCGIDNPEATHARRIVAQRFVHGVDISKEMVCSGYAVICRSSAGHCRYATW